MPENHVIEFNLSEHKAREISLSEVHIRENSPIVYWVHCDLNDQATFKKAAELFHLPESIISSSQAINKLPIFIDDDDMISLQIQATLSTEANSKNFALDHLIVHLGTQFCLTAAASTQPVIEDFLAHYTKYTRYAKTSCFIFFLILDGVTNDYAKLLFNYELLTDELELEVQTLEKNIYQRVMDNKIQIMKIKRNIISIREILMRVSGRSISVVSEHCRSSLNNLSNHSHLIINEADSIRDTLNGLLSQIDNTLMQRMNQTMKVLTGFAAIFLPLSLITGIYGMNFQWIPELSWKYGYFYSLGLLGACALLLFFLFKKKKWF